VRDLLSSRGFEVDGADGAQTTLEKVRRHHYELLILDIFLPGLDGRIVHGSVEKIAPELAVRTIFISHWAPTGAIAEFVAKRGIFLKKPFTAEELLKAIEATIGAEQDPRRPPRRLLSPKLPPRQKRCGRRGNVLPNFRPPGPAIASVAAGGLDGVHLVGPAHDLPPRLR
jgi:DNA-binding NtrC family response regulator